MPITSGSIKYERRLPRDDANTWNYKHAVAEIHWVVDLGEDEDVLAASAAEKVVTRVMQVIRWKPVPADPTPVIEAAPNLEISIAPGTVPGNEVNTPNLENLAAPNLATQHAAAEITAGIPPALKRHRRTKAEMEAARAVADRHDATAIPEPISEPGMPSFDPDPAPPAEVTDQALQNACHAKVSTGKPVAHVKELIASFSPAGLPQIPQDARRRFLEELAKL